MRAFLYLAGGLSAAEVVWFFGKCVEVTRSSSPAVAGTSRQCTPAGDAVNVPGSAPGWNRRGSATTAPSPAR